MQRNRIPTGTGFDYLAYVLLDTVVDQYSPILEDLGERLEALENETLLNPSVDIVICIHPIKQHLLMLRRALF